MAGFMAKENRRIRMEMFTKESLKMACFMAQGKNTYADGGDYEGEFKDGRPWQRKN